jgi:light-regulated signal transduction histidine kinase (bacteriophytochrome)
MSEEEERAAALRENAELRHSLEQCQAAQHAAERELHDFVYAASHDLQEPLRAVSAYGQLLQRKFATDPEISELTGFIVDGASRATALVQALLAYSRAGASMRIEMVSLNAVFQTALFKLSRRIRESGAEIVCGELPQVAADEAQLAQVFEQLLANAMLFTAGETPRVEVTAEESGDSVTLSIRDNGKGIEPRFHETIFQPFKRLHGKEVPGSGLGLPVCRKIVAAHGGRIWVESDGQRGSTFKFSLPL